MPAPPYSLLFGGNVVNIAIEMNGQPPLQVYVKPSSEPVVICRSIDLGAMERIETFEELKQYDKVGSPFSIPKAALSLAGFLPGFGAETYTSLRQQLEAFGCGIEITLLSAIPAGSGLGTSSILAANCSRPCLASTRTPRRDGCPTLCSPIQNSNPAICSITPA